MERSENRAANSCFSAPTWRSGYQLVVGQCEARHLAAEDPDRSGHLALPYILVVLEEFSVYYSFQPDQDWEGVKWQERREWVRQRRFAHAAQVVIKDMARKARAAGIHLMFMSQALPQEAGHVQYVSTTIGLAASEHAMSKAYIGAADLEEIESPGEGNRQKRMLT